MLDFLMISIKKNRYGEIEKIFPKFKVTKSKDLMIRGGDFYAIYDEETKLWCPDETSAINMIDAEIEKFYIQNKEKCAHNVSVAYMWDSDSGSIDKFHKYCQKQMRDYYKNLDEKIIFSGENIRKTDYASHILPYAMNEGDITAYEQLMSVLYSDEERHKFEWAIGSVIDGASKKLQKFIVFYGSAGTGKSTVMNLIEKLFEDYWCSFVSKDLASANAAFALEPFSRNPLVAIEHDGDLSRIESNTRLNSLVSHEAMTVNEKFKKQYSNRFNAFLFIGSNKPVKITDAKSGLLRRLIDITPTGNKVPGREYRRLVNEMDFELGAIADHCLKVFQDNPNAYDDYVSEAMLGATNDFFNFVSDHYLIFSEQEEMSLTQAWKLYRVWAEDSNVGYSMNKRVFKEELKNYFHEFYEHTHNKWNIYKDFDISKFEKKPTEKVSKKEELVIPDWLDLKEQHSKLDDYLKDCPAQLAGINGKPVMKWDNVETTLKDISTSECHYVRVPENLVTVDFDLKNKKGEKDRKLNLEAASKWPKTYAETSQGGAGIHLEYLYSGDVKKLAAVFGEDIEIKTFPADKKGSLRRRVSLCNGLDISTLSSGLPIKEEKGSKVMMNVESIKSVQSLRKMIQRNLNKEIHNNTTQSIQFIKKILDDAYASGMDYDVSNMRNNVLAFAASSTHQADACLRLVGKMKFKSEQNPDFVTAAGEIKSDSLVIFDCEVFPNLFLINWKVRGKGKPMVRMINPSPDEVAALFKMNLVGFNCRKYDNHMLYARSLGWSNQQLFELSQKIINSKKGDKDNPFFGEAYNISYTDIYDYAATKQSLKKWEIQLGIHHQELGLPWDQPVPEELWPKVSEYCDNDVYATEAVMDATEGDFLARQILATLAGGSVNDTNNSLSAKLIFGTDRHPQTQFNYRNLGEKPEGESFTWKEAEAYARGELPWKPTGKPWFPGYSFINGKSTYRDVDGTLDEIGDEKVVGEGGYVYAQPGFWGNIRTQDVASMHPSSIIAEELFGPKYTQVFADLKLARVLIKRKKFDEAKQLFDGKLAPFLEDPKMAKDLAAALKIVINSVYGLTSAKFMNLFRDERNVDNIVAKRGALFMIDLKNFVQSEGFQVAHIKTDSIKVPDITDEMITKIRKFGECYGYEFETEADFDKLCLVNKAVYIAHERNEGWEATGTQFAVPYVFKKLFSKEKIEFADMCESKQVQEAAMYLDYNEGLGEDQHDYRFIGRVGSFCPIKPGHGGAKLMRSKDQIKYAAVTGTKDHRWLESEVVQKVKEDDIDISYFEDLCEDAKETIQAYVDFDWFTSDAPYISPKYENGRPVYEDFVPYENFAC